jgi:carboxymethylenebutenolidase
MNLHPKFFPVGTEDAAKLVVAVDELDGSDAAMALAGALLRAVWAEDRNIADARDLAAVVEALRLPARRLEDAQTQAVHERYEADSRRAIDVGVFGAPTFIIDGEMFWGQDRLDFVERKLKAV